MSIRNCEEDDRLKQGKIISNSIMRIHYSFHETESLNLRNRNPRRKFDRFGVKLESEGARRILREQFDRQAIKRESIIS